MVSKIVRSNFFSGSGGVWGKNGLEAVIRPMLEDRARQVIGGKNIAALTDNSTGVAASAADYPNFPPSGVFNATSGGGVSLAAFTTSLGKIENAEFTFATAVNAVLALLGLPQLSNLEGSAGTANTIAALDKTATAASGTSAVDFDTYVAAIQAIKANQRTLTNTLTVIATALGVAGPAIPFAGQTPQQNLSPHTTSWPLQSAVAPVASASGASSVAVADGTAFLAAVANDYAALAAAWNAIFTASTGSIFTTPPLSVVAG